MHLLPTASSWSTVLGDPPEWEHWIAHYEAKGYNVIAPAYPGFEVGVEALNEDDTPIVEARVPAIVENFENAIKGLGSAPIIIGHSAGGAFTQVLFDHGYGAAGVAMNSAPRRGCGSCPVPGEIHMARVEEPGEPPQGGGLHV